MITTTRAYLDALASGLTSETGIKIIESKGWAADIKNRTLMYDPLTLLSLNPNDARGLLLHEVGHLLFTTESEPTRLEEEVPLMHSVYNAYEDIRMEYQLKKRFGDFAISSLGLVKNTMLANSQPCSSDSPESLLHEVLCHDIYRAGSITLLQRDYMGDYKKVLDKVECKEANDFYRNHMVDRTRLDNVAHLSNTANLKEYVDRYIYPILKPILDRIPPDKQKEIAQREKKYGTGGKDLKPHKRTEDAQVPLPTDNVLAGLYDPYIRTLANKLGMILKERKATRLTGAYIRGKLINKNAYKVSTDEKRIFSRRTTPDKTDYNIVFCLDGSGSMRNERHKNAYQGAFILDQVCKKLGFSTHYVHFESHAEYYPDLAKYRTFTGGDNDDAGALKLAYDRIDDTKENIIFMITDGSICTRVAKIVQKIKAKGVTLMGIGVGIDGNELQTHYGHAVNVPDPSKLPSEVLRIMKGIICR